MQVAGSGGIFVFSAIKAWLKRSWDALSRVQNRERQHLVGEMTQMREAMPLLMKHRNGQRWTPEDRRELKRYLRRLSRLSPYLIPLVMPGGLLVWPLLAWWLDRRRQQRRSEK